MHTIINYLDCTTMTKNRLLNIAVGICKMIKIFYIISFAILTIVFVHFQIDKEFYSTKIDTVSFNFKSKAMFENSTKWKANNAGDDNEVYSISEIRITSLYILYLQYSGIIFFLFLSINEFQKIMLASLNIQTFQKQNIKSFKRIGKYVLGFFVLTSFTILNFENGRISRIHISLTPLAFVLFAFIMAEIFKEGAILKEENNLTI